tara:strand:- start:456 stop:593 length:138 start_codon:yes stop_codon:yes gene_type:complete
MKTKKQYLQELLERGYDNPKLADLHKSALMAILENEESFYKRNSK